MSRMQTAPASEKQQDAAPMVFAPSFNFASSGTTDYSSEIEITADEMSDDLFAAVERGDVATVQGLTGGPSMFAGPAMLLARAQEKNAENAADKGYAHADLGAWQDAGMTEIMMFRTGGNAQLARLLLSQLQTNYLLSIGGVMADEMARDMGNHNLSEFLRQMQREEATREEGPSIMDRFYSAQRQSLINFTFAMASMPEPDHSLSAEATKQETSFLKSVAECIGLGGLFNNCAKPQPLAIVPEPTIGNAMRGFVKRFAPSF